MLHTREFFADCKRALKKGGILVTQNGLPFLFPEHLRATTRDLRLAVRVRRALPVHAALLLRRALRAQLGERQQPCSLSPNDAARRMTKRGITRYYTPAVHRAAFALPGYVADAIASRNPGRIKRAAKQRRSAKAGRRQSVGGA